VRLVQRPVGNFLANTPRLLNCQRQILPLYTRSCHQQAGRRMAGVDPLRTTKSGTPRSESGRKAAMCPRMKQCFAPVTSACHGLTPEAEKRFRSGGKFLWRSGTTALKRLPRSCALSRGLRKRAPHRGDPLLPYCRSLNSRGRPG
jgi:hypothetical protein